MTRASIEVILSALNAAQVRYLVAGGFAVVAHGYLRFTADLDLVLDLDAENARRTLEVLQRLGYQPRVPVPLAQFADAQARQFWAEHKNMQVFSLASSLHPATEIDLFIAEPFDFASAYAHAAHLSLMGVEVPVVPLATLLAMKRQAGRPQDLQDIRALEELHGAQPHE